MVAKRLSLRLAAATAVLLLAACSDRQQASQFFQDFADTKHGPTAVVSNTLSPGTGNPQADAALGAGDVIKQFGQSEVLEAQATDARDKGDGAAALANIEAAVKLRPTNPYTNLTRMGIALQYGQNQRDWAGDVIREQMAVYDDARNRFSDEDVKRRQFAYMDAGVAESERTLKALGEMTNMPPRERRQRQALAAAMAQRFYSYRAELHRMNGDHDARDADEAKVKLYEQMGKSLTNDDPNA